MHPLSSRGRVATRRAGSAVSTAGFAFVLDVLEPMAPDTDRPLRRPRRWLPNWALRSQQWRPKIPHVVSTSHLMGAKSPKLAGSRQNGHDPRFRVYAPNLPILHISWHPPGPPSEHNWTAGKMEPCQHESTNIMGSAACRQVSA